MSTLGWILHPQVPGLKQNAYPYIPNVIKRLLLYYKIRIMYYTVNYIDILLIFK